MALEGKAKEMGGSQILCDFVNQSKMLILGIMGGPGAF